jgi:hypothetical protein
MKRIASLALAAGMLASPLLAAAQVAAAPDVCPCSDYRFTPKTEKAKAVAAFWDARRKYKLSATVASMALFITVAARQPNRALSDSEQAMGQAEDDLLQSRGRAVALHGLTVGGDGGPDSPVVVTLVKGVDYALVAPR